MSGQHKLASYKRLALICILSMGIFGCTSITQIVPIQMTRVTQTEAYHQTFELQTPDNSNSPHITDTTQWHNHRVDDVFSRLLGKANWQQIKDRYGLGALRDELLREEVYIRGFLSFTTYLDPTTPQYFIAEGTGRFFLVRKKNQAILLSGDFNISPNRHSIKTLDRGHIILDLDVILSRIPEEVTYLHEAPLKYKIFFDNTLKDEKVYQLDYQRYHEVHLPASGNTADSRSPCIIN